MALRNYGLGMVQAIEAAVRFFEQPPEQQMLVQTEWVNLRLTLADWAEASASLEDTTPHNAAHPHNRGRFSLSWPRMPGGVVPEELLRAELAANPDRHSALYRAWPMPNASEIVGDLWPAPAYLRKPQRC